MSAVRSLSRSLFRARPAVAPFRTAPVVLRVPLLAPRSFGTTPAAFAKKKGKSSFNAREEEDDDSSSGKGGSGAVDFDAHFVKLEADIAKVVQKLEHDLSKLRAGRPDPSILENLDVVLDKTANEKAVLKEIAHVVTKGRALAVSVYEATHVKKVISAIQTAQLNLQPVVDAKNPQVVNVPVPPPTKESRNEMVKKAQEAGQKAQDGLRNARGVTHKKLQAEKKSVRPDDLKKAEKKMEDIVKKRKTELEAIVEKAKKTIQEV